MQQIAELERRITAALERIGRGVESLGSRPVVVDTGNEAEIVRLTEALDEERMANAQLSERLRVVRKKDAAAQAELTAQLDTATGLMETQETELRRLHRSVAELTEELASLRAAAVKGATDPHAINRIMLVELEALRSVRAAEAVELAEIVAALDPLIEEPRADA